MPQICVDSFLETYMCQGLLSRSHTKCIVEMSWERVAHHSPCKWWRLHVCLEYRNRLNRCETCIVSTCARKLDLMILLRYYCYKCATAFVFVRALHTLPYLQLRYPVPYNYNALPCLKGCSVWHKTWPSSWVHLQKAVCFFSLTRLPVLPSWFKLVPSCSFKSTPPPLHCWTRAI